jgi:integrase
VSKALQCAYVFPGTKPDQHLHTFSATDAVSRICKILIQRGWVTEQFRPRDLRRTVETHLARLGVPKEVRAHLQSHDLGGIQNRHYNRHDFFAEKLEALMKWEAHLSSCAQLAVAERTAKLDLATEA